MADNVKELREIAADFYAESTSPLNAIADSINAAADEIAALRAEVARLTAERDAAQPVAWQYKIKIDGAWSSWLLSEHYRSPCKAEEQRPLYAHPATDTLRQVREAVRSALNFIENTEAELNIRLDSGDKLRAALALLTKE